METFRQLRGQADRAIAVVAVLIGAVFLVAGYFGVSGTALAPEQIPYVVSGGLGGIFLAGVGSALWLSADLRDEWNKLDRIEQVLRDSWQHTEVTIGADGVFSVVPIATSTGPDEVPASDDGPVATANPRRNGRRPLTVDR